MKNLQGLSLSAILFAGAGSNAFALKLNDKFYGKGEAKLGYSAGFYSGDIKKAIDEASDYGVETNKVSHSIKAGVGFNVFYNLNDKINPFAGLNVEGKYAINGEFIKNNNFQNFLNVNAKLGSSFKINKDVAVRPYALVGISVNQLKQKGVVEGQNSASANRNTEDRNTEGAEMEDDVDGYVAPTAEEAAEAYFHHNNKNSAGSYGRPIYDNVKVYTTDPAVLSSQWTTIESTGYEAVIVAAGNLNDFVYTLRAQGLDVDYSENFFNSNNRATSNLFALGSSGEYAFLDYSNATPSTNLQLSSYLEADKIITNYNEAISDLAEAYRIYKNGDDYEFGLPIRFTADFMDKWFAGQEEQRANVGENNNTPATDNNSATDDNAVEENVPAENISNKTSYNVGLNVGAGVEFVVKDRYLVGAEYRYTDVKVNGLKFQLHNVGVNFGVQFL